MKCEKCEQELAGGAVICRQCGFNNALQRMGGWRARRELTGQGRADRSTPRSSKDATLIRFPISPSKSPSPAASTETQAGVFPPWRIQLNEKLRQIRERRRLESEEQAGSSPAAEPNPIVAAAVSRLRRATPPSSGHTSRSLSQGAQATARAIKYEEEPVSEPESAKLRRRETSTHSPATPAQSISRAPNRSEASTADRAARHAPLIASAAARAEEEQSVRSEPLTPAEETAASSVRAKSSAHGPASLPARVAAWVIDLELIAFSFLPFFTVFAVFNAEISRGSFFILGSIACGITFIYHLLTVALAGRTCGMALVKLRVVDAASESVPPSLAQAAGRACGAIASLLLFPVNLAMIGLHSQRLSLSDQLSGTVVVRQ